LDGAAQSLCRAALRPGKNRKISDMDMNTLFLDNEPCDDELLALGEFLDDVLLRPREVARLLGLSRSGIYRMITRGELPHVRLGRSVRVPQRAFKAWLAVRTRLPQPPA
jgi:excisionase family DNA binding protein